jgi:hypothetical protein
VVEQKKEGRINEKERDRLKTGMHSKILGGENERCDFNVLVTNTEEKIMAKK